MSDRVLAGRYLDKQWDWDAFPSNSGYSELERAQMRYIGSGGSPKADGSTLAPGAFTCTLIYQEPGKRAATHYHHVEELFFVHSGTLTMTWQFGDELVDFTLGPGDAVLNPVDRPHGFRNDGPGDVLMQIMVATAGKMLPTYTEHPKFPDPSTLRPASPERAAAAWTEIAPWVARAGAGIVRRSAVDGGTLGLRPYVMPAEHGGQVVPTTFAFGIETLERGASTPRYTREVEEAFMVLDGVLDVETTGDDGTVTVQRFGARDLAFIPAGVSRRLRNTDAVPLRMAAILGDAAATPMPWERVAVVAGGAR